MPMKNDTKNLIIDTTITLIKEVEKEPESITIRDISKKAGIAVSQINYHFQTKENLLSQCAQKMISNIIEKFDDCVAEMSAMTGFERLENMLFLTFTYLYENENLARISILSDHRTPSLTDNTSQTMKAYKPLVDKVCNEKGIANSSLVEILLMQSLQGIFLRTNIIKTELGVDFRNPKERGKILHEILERFFMGM